MPKSPTPRRKKAATKRRKKARDGVPVSCASLWNDLQDEYQDDPDNAPEEFIRPYLDKVLAQDKDRARRNFMRDAEVELFEAFKAKYTDAVTDQNSGAWQKYLGNRQKNYRQGKRVPPTAKAVAQVVVEKLFGVPKPKPKRRHPRASASDLWAKAHYDDILAQFTKDVQEHKDASGEPPTNAEYGALYWAARDKVYDMADPRELDVFNEVAKAARNDEPENGEEEGKDEVDFDILPRIVQHVVDHMAAVTGASITMTFGGWSPAQNSYTIASISNGDLKFWSRNRGLQDKVERELMKDIWKAAGLAPIPVLPYMQSPTTSPEPDAQDDLRRSLSQSPAPPDNSALIPPPPPPSPPPPSTPPRPADKEPEEGAGVPAGGQADVDFELTDVAAFGSQTPSKGANQSKASSPSAPRPPTPLDPALGELDILPPLSPRSSHKELDAADLSTPEEEEGDDDQPSLPKSKSNVPPSPHVAPPSNALLDELTTLSVDKGTKTWIKLDLPRFLGVSSDEGWLKLLLAWYKFEQRFDGVYKQLFTSELLKDCPQMYNSWKRKRHEALESSADVDDRFHKQFVAWYMQLQPDSRSPKAKFHDMAPPAEVDGRDFVSLHVVGGRGVVQLVFGIAWMLRWPAQTGATAASLPTPQELANDLTLVLGQMTAAVGATVTNGVRYGLPNSGPSNPPTKGRKRKADEVGNGVEHPTTKKKKTVAPKSKAKSKSKSARK
ncbi:hypothetical protein EXIGLDRAFT_762334 [Exidia glandulosa HHB12029]|uniref:Uncharacterized protein n=1 Tax=Exidia glandulosa HHB12029 TaxID=1314781 RepID=A0A165MRW3_EXIGL|nr:hypothetical protein EXIGLDRAFT_762334 [Exidia glandulosa HHB12029]